MCRAEGQERKWREGLGKGVDERLSEGRGRKGKESEGQGWEGE